MTGLNPKAVYQVIRDLRAEVGQVHAAQQVLASQNRELIERLDAMEAEREEEAAKWYFERINLMGRIEAVLKANERLSVERAAFCEALALKALRAMSVPVRVDQATVERLLAVGGKR